VKRCRSRAVQSVSGGLSRTSQWPHRAESIPWLPGRPEGMAAKSRLSIRMSL
jgi:hypothetical protein